MSDVQGNIQITAEFLQRLGIPRSQAVSAAAQLNRSFGNGTGDSQVDGVAPFTVTPAGGATVEIDLQALTDMEGAAVSFQEIRGFIAYAQTAAGETANADSVHMEQGAATKWTTGFLQGTAPEIPIAPNGFIVGIAPKASTGVWTVTGASKNIGFANQSGGVAARVTGLFFGRLS